MANDLIIGLQLSAIGLTVTFLALGLLIGLMWLLLKLFPASKPKTAAAQASKTETKDDQQLEEMAVALAVGICLLEADDAFQQRDPNLGKLLEN